MESRVRSLTLSTLSLLLLSLLCSYFIIIIILQGRHLPLESPLALAAKDGEKPPAEIQDVR